MNAQEREPTNDDLSEVRRLGQWIIELRSELRSAEAQYAEAWKRVPADETILRKPYKSDIAITCIECGHRTLWRDSKSRGKCMPVCRTTGPIASRLKDTEGVPKAAWNILFDEEC